MQQHSVSYFELQFIIFFVIITITYLALQITSESKPKEQKLKIWNKMISCYDGINLSKDDEILLKQTFKNTIKNRIITVKNDKPRKIQTIKKVQFDSQVK